MHLKIEINNNNNKVERKVTVFVYMRVFTSDHQTFFGINMVGHVTGAALAQRILST